MRRPFGVTLGNALPVIGVSRRYGPPVPPGFRAGRWRPSYYPIGRWFHGDRPPHGRCHAMPTSARRLPLRPGQNRSKRIAGRTRTAEERERGTSQSTVATWTGLRPDQRAARVPVEHRTSSLLLEEITRPMQRQRGLLLDRLDRYETHGRSGDRLADRLRIPGINLPRFT